MSHKQAARTSSNWRLAGCRLTGMTWQRWLLRAYLTVEAAVIVALLLALIAVTAIGVVLVTILLVSGSSKRRRR